MSSIVRTLSLNDDDGLTAKRIHDLLDTLQMSGIQRPDAASDTSFITISASAPSSPKNGEAWINTSPGSGMWAFEFFDGTIFRGPDKIQQVKNTSAVDPLPAGTLVTLDPITANQPLDLSIAITPVAARDSIPIGVTLVSLAANVVGPALVHGKHLALRKQTGTAWTLGQFIVPSTTDGVMTANNAPGQAAVGIVTKDAGAGDTTGQGMIFGPNPGSYGIFRTIGTLLFSGSPPTLGTWSGSMTPQVFFTWPVDNAATKAHFVEVDAQYTGTPNDAKHPVSIWLRARNDAASGSIPSLYPHVTGQVIGRAVIQDFDHFVTQMIVPHNISGTATQGEFYVTASVPTVSNLILTLFDRGSVVGGAVL